MAHDKNFDKVRRMERADINNLLDEVEFPAEKADLINMAREQGAEEHVIDALRHIPNQEYTDRAKVEEFIG